MANSSQEVTSSTLKDVEFTYDEKTAMTMTDFFHQYKNNFPQLVIITEGYNGDNSCEYMCTSQVFRIHTFSEQCRVLAEEGTGGNGYVSLPVQSESVYHVVQPSGQEGIPKPLATILLDNAHFPIKVREGRPGSKTLTLQGEYKESYLIGNCIHDGVLFAEPVNIVPSGMMKCAVVTGMEGKSEDIFQKQLKMYADFIEANQIAFDRTAGRTDTFPVSKAEVPSLAADLTLRDSSYCTRISPRTNQVEWYTDIADVSGVAAEQGSTINDEPASPDDRSVTTESRDRTNSYVQLQVSTDNARDVRDNRRDVRYHRQDSRPSVTIHTDTNDSERRNVDSRESGLHPPELPPRGRNLRLDKNQNRREEETNNQHHLKSLTVCDIGDILKQLGLKKYVSKFSKKRINGKVLACLNDDDLREEFGLTKSEVVRLRMFIDDGDLGHNETLSQTRGCCEVM